MIQINLLPQEFRQRSRTPIKYTLAVAGVVTIVSSLFAWWAMFAFGVRAEVDSELAVLRDTMDSISPQISYHRSLERENTQHKSRETTLGSITQNRISWTRKVDQLIDVVNRGGDDKRSSKYLIWFDDLSAEQSSDDRRGAYGGIRCAGHAGSENFAHVANFLEDVEASEFAADFYAPLPPEGSQTSVDTELLPPKVWSFPLQVDLLPPEERQ